MHYSTDRITHTTAFFFFTPVVAGTRNSSRTRNIAPVISVPDSRHNRIDRDVVIETASYLIVNKKELRRGNQRRRVRLLQQHRNQQPGYKLKKKIPRENLHISPPFPHSSYCHAVS